MNSSENFIPQRGFEFQNWPVYRKSRALISEIALLCEKLPGDGRRGLVDQISRASQSVCLNIAEGCARSTSKDKANFFRMAKGSLFECVAVSDLLVDLELLSGETAAELQNRAAEIGKMLSGLIKYVENNEKGAPERLRR